MKSKSVIVFMSSLFIMSLSYAQTQWTTDVDGGQNNLINLKKLSVFKAATTASSAQNLLSWSEVLGDGQGWTVQNLVSDHDAAADGAGGMTLEKITNNFVASNVIYQRLDVDSIAGTYNFSWDVKKGTATNFLYAVYDLTNWQYIIEPVSYASSTNTSSVTRMSVTFSKPVGCKKIQVVPYTLSADTAITPQATTGSLYLGRLQVRKTSYPASYVKTEANIQPGINTASTPARYAIYTDDSANVGIGTTTPMGVSKLNVHNGLLMLSGTTPGWGGPAMGFTDNTNVVNGKWAIEYEPNAGGLNFTIPWNGNFPGYSNYNLFLKNNSGYVGINNSNPTERLDITGNIKFSGAIIPNNNAGTAGQVLTSAGPNAAPIWTTSSGGGSSPWTTSGNNSYYTNLDGNISIGTNTFPAGHKLAVNGSAIFNKVRIRSYDNWPDYVFNDNYELPTLKNVEAFIKANNHLPDIPPAAEVVKNGIDVGDNQAVLLKKIEELTLYIIEQDKKIEKLQSEKEQLQILQKQIDEIKALIQKK